MGKHKNLPLLFVVLILSVVILGSTFSLAAGPTANPPSSNITPNFYGIDIDYDADVGQNLDVTGNTDVGGYLDVTGDADVGGDLNMHGGHIEDESDNIVSIATDLTVHDDLRVVDTTTLVGDTHFFGSTTAWIDFFSYGSITSSDSIGSFYTVKQTHTVSSGGTEIPGTSCKSGDILSGCSAVFNFDNSSDRFFGTYPDPTDSKMCRAAVKDGGGGSDTVDIYARCFDSDGSKSGEY